MRWADSRQERIWERPGEADDRQILENARLKQPSNRAERE
jgi:hypothetical protein